MMLTRLDPRMKFLALLVLTPASLLSHSIGQLLMIAGVVFGAIIVSPISFRTMLAQLRRIIWFAFFITVINAFTTSGNVLLRIGDFYATVEGVRQGVLLSVRIALLLLLSALFARTTTLAAMVDGVESLLSPLRKTLGHWISLVSLTLNFVPMLIRSAQRIKAAQIARGADVDSSFFRQVRFAAQAALPLFVSAFRSSQQLAEAMDARCYDPQVQRTPFSRLQLSLPDRVMLVALPVFVVVLTLL